MNAITNLPVVQQQPDASEIMEAVILAGDLSKLTADERTSYYMKTCSSLGLNPYTKPFDYIRLSGREVLYATKGCADQLRAIRRISLEIVDRKVVGDLMVITARATTPDGRSDEDMAAISVKGLAGEALANAMMKVTTKAKRRVTLSICGLGMLDETEVQSVLAAEREAGPSADRIRPPQPAPSLEPPPPATFAVAVPFGGEPETFPRTRGGARAAFKEIVAAWNDGYRDILALNNDVLDEIAERIPTMADEIAEFRAGAAEAMAAKDEPENEPDTFVRDFVAGTDDDFSGDIPPH